MVLIQTEKRALEALETIANNVAVLVAVVVETQERIAAALERAYPPHGWVYDECQGVDAANRYADEGWEVYAVNEFSDHAVWYQLRCPRPQAAPADGIEASRVRSAIGRIARFQPHIPDHAGSGYREGFNFAIRAAVLALRVDLLDGDQTEQPTPSNEVNHGDPGDLGDE